MGGLKAYLIVTLSLIFCCRMVQILLPTKEEAESMIAVGVDDQIKEYPLEEYVQGVLNAELPQSFQLEAMKAQAVAARTYALKTAQTNKHASFDICSSSQCCQGFRPADKGESEQSKSYLAATATKGEVLVYEDRLIEASYFACSGGKTEDASAVWGNYFPYLISLDSTEEENSEDYNKSFSFSKDQIENLLNVPKGSDLSISDIHYTPGNGIDTILISGLCFTGTELRKKLSLPSTYMDISVEDNHLIIHTKGYGHRVGLSQLGAQTMAKSGADYKEILQYYYPNSRIVKVDKNNQFS